MVQGFNVFFIWMMWQVKILEKEIAEQEKWKVKLSPALKQKVARDIIEKLRSLREGGDGADDIGWLEKFM
jgi:hypothetical protein